MELKKFQQKVIHELEDFLQILNNTKRADIAYNKFWEKREISTGLNGLKGYKNNVKNVPHVCFKVPTGGGKTFIACNSIKPIFEAMPFTKTKAVVWLVPSNSILEQTINNLKNTDHPYRQKINLHFSGKVEIYTKDQLLNGQNFNPITINEQLSIFILSYDSLRSNNKENRKIYQENGNLKDFSKSYKDTENLIPDVDETALIQVINQMNPVIIVDESHNAETELSLEMLTNLNPSFILDLTATPRNNSNIISYVDSLQLKNENMVKLPVVVYNHHKMEDVIADSIDLRKNLELKAIEEEEKTGKYIRPIVLFQAQPKGKEDNETFEKLKKKLIDSGIAENEIAIKTSNINELKNVSLTDRDCSIRFIITVNALKEGWDCPFAYILATLANKSSKVDVEQILGRILRQPYVKKHNEQLLNMSYVFTSSDNFRDTLDNIVRGLNKAGYSKKDFRVAEENIKSNIIPEEKIELKQQQIPLENKEEVEQDEDFLNFSSENVKTEIEQKETATNIIIETAKQVQTEYEEIVKTENYKNPFETVSSELREKMNIFEVNSIYKDDIKNIIIPEFFIKIPTGVLFGEPEKKLNKENLLDKFSLKDKDTVINFEIAQSDIYAVDLEEQGNNEYTPKYLKMKKEDIDYINNYVSKLPSEDKLKKFKDIIFGTLGRIDSISEKEIKDYIERVLAGFTKEQIYELENSPYKYANEIKKKIINLQEKYLEEEFFKMIEQDKIHCKKNYTFKDEITIMNNIDTISKSLYQAEEKMNDFEFDVITKIASLENIKFWHRNMERKDFAFCLNGFINHYPDFILYTKSNKIIVVETKGDHLFNEDSKQKLSLGRKWQELAGQNFKYYMVFQDLQVENSGAYNLGKFLEILKEL